MQTFQLGFALGFVHQEYTEIEPNIIDDIKENSKTLSIKGILDKLIQDYKAFKKSAKSNDWESFGKNLSKMDHWIKKVQENKDNLN